MSRPAYSSAISRVCQARRLRLGKCQAASGVEGPPMTDWQQVFSPMELALAEMLAQSEATFIDTEAEPPLSGAVPLLDEVLAPVSRVVARAEEHARAAE